MSAPLPVALASASLIDKVASQVTILPSTSKMWAGFARSDTGVPMPSATIKNTGKAAFSKVLAMAAIVPSAP
jgi:hypothetical protein